jgi:hypothetical protein
MWTLNWVPIWSLWPNIRFLPSIVAEKNEHICSMCIKINKVGKQEVGIWWIQKPRSPKGEGVYCFTSVLPSVQDIFRRIFLSNCWGSRNLMDPKTLPTIWGTYMNLVIKYQISAINSCWEKCDKKCAYMFNVYKDQLSRQTGSRNLTGPKMLPMHIFRHIFLSNYWWQRSDIWSQASYRYPISWEAYACDQISDLCHQ